MALWIRVLAGCAGLVVQLIVLDAAVRTFLLTRVARVRLNRAVTLPLGWIFRKLAHERRTYTERDHTLSVFASVVLLSYQTLWLLLSIVAFAFAFVAAGVPSFARAFDISGSSLFTLGFATGRGGAESVLSFAEAGVGLTLLGLLIAFIPTLYSAFQRRELSVSRLSVRAGIPATPWGVLEMAQSVGTFEPLYELWREWEQWFIEVGETQSTLPILNYYRSPSPDQTWIGAAAAVLDSAAIFNAAVDEPPAAAAGLCIRAGWLTLRRLADFLRIPYPSESDRHAPISVSRDDFNHVLARLERSGVQLVADRDAAWRDFVGWRVNYDAIIERCYELFTCPRVNWQVAETAPLLRPSNERGADD